jgi:hypothetical protein
MKVLWSIEEAIASGCRTCGSFPCGCGLDGPPFRPSSLLGEGYKTCAGALPLHSGCALSCDRCGGSLQYEGYLLLDGGDLLAYRAFAVCRPCRRWLEV